jgi:phage-related minor tail protein
MSDNDQRPVIIKPTMDASGVRPGAEQVEKTVREMAQTVGAEGRKAGEGLGAVGEGAKKGADATVRETGRIRAALQRLQAETESGGSRNADYYERIAKLRGADVNALKPAFDAARAAEAAQKAATGSLGAIGMSAAQTTAALRQVPAQFTDIVTSLASGQRPLQVFLQQGGQLKDVFGGAGAAVRALTGYVAGLITPLSVLAAGVAAVGAGWLLGAREGEEYRRALILTGNAAGVTADQLGSMARAISGGSSITQGKAAEVLTLIAKSGDVAADSLQRYTQAAIELERAGGPAAEETAKAFSDLAKDPLAASLKLTESTRYLSAATAEQIKQLQAQGRATDAAKLAQDTYAQAIEQRTPEMASTLGLVERAWLGIKDATKAAADAALNIGRGGGLAQQLADAEASIDIARRLKENAGGSLLGRFGQSLEDRGTAQRDLLREQIRLTERAATAAGERAKQEQAGLAWLKDSDKYLSSQAKFAAEIVRIRQLGLAAGKSEAEIAERIRQTVQQTYGAKSDSAADKDASARARALEEQARLLAELSGMTGSYAKDLAALDDARRRGIVSEERYGELVRELVSRQPVLRKAAEDQKQLAEDQARASKRAAQDFEDYLKGLDRSIAAGDKSLDQMRLELVELAAGKDVRRELQLLELERLATTYDQAAAVAELNGEEQARYQRLAEQTREEIRWRRDLAAATDQNTVREANDRAAKDAARDWERALDQVGQSLADAIFEGGRNAGQLLKDYFRTLVLQPVVKSLVNPVAAVITSALGVGSPASAAASTLGGAGNVGSLGNLLGLGGAVSGFGATLGAGVSATLGGTGLGSLLSASGAAIGNGAFAAGAGLAIGAAVPYIAAAAAVYYLGKKAFGRELKDTGVQGSFGAAGDFGGSNFAFYEGGWLRKDKTTTSPLSSEMEAVLDAGGRAANTQAQAYAKALGLPVSAMTGYVQQIKLSLSGLNQEQIQAAIEKAVYGYQDALLARYSAQLEPLRRLGETLSQTAERLVSLQAASGALNALGGAFSVLANASVGVREQFIAMAGGMDALSAQTLSYAQNYYSRDEIAGLKASEVQAALQAVGLNAGDLSSREQFRTLVDSTDVRTDAGRQQLAQLLAVGDEFAQIADYLAGSGGTLASTAALAPQTTALAALFSQPAQAQVDATDRVAEGVASTNQWLGKILAAMQSQAAAPVVAAAAEVNGGWVYEPTGGA